MADNRTYIVTTPGDKSTKTIKVTHTDEAGNTTVEKRVIKDNKALVTEPYSIESTLARAASTGEKVYKKGSGYTSNVFDIPSSVTLDTTTGKIRIMAPKAVLDSSDFSAQYGDGSILKQLSATYKANPQSKVSTNDGRQLTVPELVDEWDKGIKDLTVEVKRNIDRRDYLTQFDSRAASFDDNQTRIASTVTVDIGDVKASNTDRAYIPKWVLLTQKGKMLTDYDSFDEASGTIERQDLMKWWNLSNFTRDELAAFEGTIRAYLSTGSWGDDQYDYDELDEEGRIISTGKEDNLTGKTEMAKTMSFLQFVIRQDPSGTFAQKAGTALEAGGVDFLLGFTQAFTGTASALETGAAFLTNNLDTWKNFTSLDAAVKDSTAYYNKAVAAANDSAAAIGSIANIGGVLVGHIAVSKVATTVGGWVGEGTEAITAGRAASKADAMTQPILATAEKLFVGQAIGVEEYAQVANNIQAGSKLLVQTLAAGGKLGAVFNNAMAIHKTIKATPLVGTAIDFLADTIIDAAVYDPQAMRTILNHVRSGEVSKEDYDYAIAQFADNLKAWAVFRGAGIALKGTLTKTTLGKAANLKVSQFLTGLDNWAYDVDNGIKSKILGKSVVESLSDKLAEATQGSAHYRRIQNKLTTAQNNEVLRQFKETFASGKNWDVVLDGMKEKGLIKADSNLSGLKKYISEATTIQNNIRAWNNAIDNFKRGVQVENIRMLDPNQNPFTAQTNDAIVDWLSKFEGTERANTKLTWDEKHVTMSVESSNYLGYQVSGERARTQATDPNVPENIRDRARAYTELAEEKVAEMAEILGPDITTKLDDALPLYRNEYSALNEYASSYGYINAIEQAEFEDADLWETGYTRTQRVYEDTGVRITSETGESLSHPVVETQFYNLTDRDYVDFEQTRAQYRNRIAEAAYEKNLLDVYMLNGQATAKTVISAEETESVRKMVQVKQQLVTGMSTLLDEASATFALRAEPKNRAISDAQFERTVYGLGYEDTSRIMTDFVRIDNPNGDTLVAGFTGSAISSLGDIEKSVYWYTFDLQLNDGARRYLESRGVVDLDSLSTKVKEEGTEFINALNQAYLMDDKDFRASEIVKKLARNKYDSQIAYVKDLKLASSRRIFGLYGGTFGKDASNDVINAIADYSDGWIDSVIAGSDSQWAVKGASEYRAGIIGAEEDLTREYTVLENIADAEAAKQRVYDMIDAELKARYGNAFSSKDFDGITHEAHNIFDSTLESRISMTKAALLESTTDEALRRDVLKEVSDLDKQIRETKAGIGKSVRKKGEVGDIILATDDLGRQVYYQVDPALASLYNRKQRLGSREANWVAKTNYAMSKAFRLGTTTANLTSFGNQLFRDTGNAIVVGGMWDTLKHNADNFRDVFGDDVVEQIKAYDPYQAKVISELATSKGITEAEALRGYELNRAKLIADNSTEVQAYREFREMVYGDKKLSTLQRMDNAVQGVIESIDSKTNGIREVYLRKNVYMRNLNDALGDGNSISQARTFAEFAERNATTNFGRTLYHLQSISESTPYFAAAINGTKSFWRMFELDPVGITGRFMGGIVLPVMYLTGLSLSNEEDAKIYKNLPEYTRSGNLTFVTNGQVFNIPLPQELQNLVDPFRQFVEYTHDANRSTFWKLLANDLLGLSPVDLQGFSSVDWNDLGRDPSFLDMTGRGFSRLFSQAAPVPIKTAYMGFTGIDPYTGKQITGTTRYYYDSKTDSVQMMDYTQNMFARQVAAWFGSDNPAIIEKIVSGVAGNTTTDVLGFITGLFAAHSGKDPLTGSDYGWGEYGNGAAEQIANRLTSPVTSPSYDLTYNQWSQTIRQLSALKESILNDKQVKTLQTELSQETDPEKRKKLVARLQTYADDFQQQVREAISDLAEKGGTFDRHKYASVLQLLNFNTDSGWETATSLSQVTHSNIFYEGREQAIQTLVDMGVSGANDVSVFGYYYTDRNGETKFKYNSPLAILNARNQWYGRSEIDAAAIQATLEANIPDLSEQRSEMWAAVKAESDYDAKDKIREAWNEKIIGGIMPYISNLSTDQVVNNNAVVNYLEQYIQVPSWYEKVKNRYVSSGYDAETGTYKLDKNKAFIESYLRAILEERK